jgi:hypothetical protein
MPRAHPLTPSGPLVFAGFLDLGRRRNLNDQDVPSRVPTGPHRVARVPFDQGVLCIGVMPDLGRLPRGPIGIAPAIRRDDRERPAVVTIAQLRLDALDSSLHGHALHRVSAPRPAPAVEARC